MPIITAGVIAAIGAQIASASYNHRHQSKLMKQMQAMQQDFESKLQAEGMERVWGKFDELCKFQKQLEEDLHAGRIKNITDYYEKSMKDIVAYSQVLSNWPLWVLPFVMKDESLFDKEQQNNSQKVALHCLLSHSNDNDFNNAIHNELENRLNQYFNKYWSAVSTHPVIFYNGAWKTVHAEGVIDNLRNQLNSLPTIVISPWIPEDDDEFHFEISIWGIPNIEKVHKFKPNDIKFHYKQKQKAYTKEDKTQILNELCPALEAFISYIADQYYWGYYQIPPMLPSLLSKGIIPIDNGELEEYKKGYLAMFDKYVVEDNEVNRLNMLTQPEKSLELCESIADISSKEDLQYMSEYSLQSLRRVRMCDYQRSATNILTDVPFLRDDILFLSKLSEFQKELKHQIVSIIDNLQKNVPCEIFDIEEITLLDIFEWAIENKNRHKNAAKFQVDINEQNIIASFFDSNGNVLSINNVGIGIFRFQSFVLPDTIKIENIPFTIEITKIDYVFNLIKKTYGAV